MTLTVIFAYISGILFFVLWIYLNTKIVFSLVSKKRYFLRIVVWVFIGWLSALFVYAMFMAFIMLAVFIANTLLGFTV